MSIVESIFSTVVFLKESVISQCALNYLQTRVLREHRPAPRPKPLILS